MTSDEGPVHPEGARHEPVTAQSSLQYARPTATRKPSVGDWVLAFFGLVGALPFVFLGAAAVYQVFDRGVRLHIIEVAAMSGIGLTVGGLGVWNAVRIVRRRKLPSEPE